MARSRNIKPGFFTNDLLAEINPLGRLLFAGMWCHSDREGRLKDRPNKLKAEVLPYDDCDTDSLLNDLQNREFIIRYEVNGIKYIQILNFKKHQNPHMKEQASEIPEYDKHKTCTMQALDKSDKSIEVAGLIPDSLSLDSLKLPPEESLSGKPDVVLKNGKQKFKGDAESLITFLNEKTGKQFRPVEANLDMVASRLKEGITVEDCRAMIAKKAREWKGTEMEQYLRPATLFNRTKFAQYIGELCHD